MYKFSALIILICLPSICIAENNYLQLRVEAGSNKEDGIGFFGTRTILENTSLKNWTLGSKIGTGKDGYTYINPYALYKIGKIKVGSIYLHDSFNSESIGPIIRYSNVLENISANFEYSYNIDTRGKNNLHDLWINVSQNKQAGLKIGSEIWYYHYADGTENLKLRPIKLSYVIPNSITPFVMLQRHWNDRGIVTDAILGGIEIKF